MRKYDISEVMELHDAKEEIIVFNNPVIVKASPSEKRAGYFDMHELDTLQVDVLGSDAGKKNNNRIETIRQAMGFPNLNLNEAEIITKYECKTLANHEAGIWRYFRRRSKQKKRPVFIMIHGGGWIGGSPYTVENFCKLIAERADAIVFNLEYGLAPEHPFPEGLEDCFRITKHICSNAKKYGIDPERIAIGGDSAGGNLAAAVCLMAQDRGYPKLALQVLMYAAVVRCDAKAPGYEWSLDEYEISEEQRDLILTKLDLGRPLPFGEDFLDCLCMRSPVDALNPYYSPMLTVDKSGLPKALIMTAEFDGLRQQNEFYAAQLARAGVTVKTIRYKGTYHAIIDRLGYSPQAEDMADEISNALKNMGRFR